MNDEFTPFPRRAFHGNPARMGIDDMLDNRKPQAGPPQFPASGGIRAVKPLEEPRKVFWSDSDAMVPKRNGNLGIRLLHLDFNAASRPAVFDGVIQKIHESLLDQCGIEMLLKAFLHRTAGFVSLFHRPLAGRSGGRTSESAAADDFPEEFPSCPFSVRSGTVSSDRR